MVRSFGDVKWRISDAFYDHVCLARALETNTSTWSIASLNTPITRVCSPIFDLATTQLVPPSRIVQQHFTVWQHLKRQHARRSLWKVLQILSQSFSNMQPTRALFRGTFQLNNSRFHAMKQDSLSTWSIPVRWFPHGQEVRPNCPRDSGLGTRKLPWQVHPI